MLWHITQYPPNLQNAPIHEQKGKTYIFHKSLGLNQPYEFQSLVCVLNGFFVRRMLIRHFLDWGSSFFNFSPHFIKNRFDGAKKRMISEFAVTIFSDWIYTLWHKRLITCFTFCHHPWEKGQRRACFSALVFLLGLDYDGKLKKATRKTAISIPEIRVEISFRPKFASSSSRFLRNKQHFSHSRVLCSWQQQ